MHRRAVLAMLAALPFAAAPARARAGKARVPNGYLLTRWSQDPWARGSYSYLAKGASPRHRQHLAESLGGTLFFAGEAMATHPSTVHGALLSGRRAAAEITATGAQRVAVIGAGFAGLGAAQVLAETAEVTVFEARDRIGGRVWTSTALGVPLDLGASWIHGPNGNPLSDLAEATGTKTIYTDMEGGVLRSHLGAMPTSSPDWTAETEAQTSYGADPAELAQASGWEGESFGGGDWLFPNGYASLLPALSGAFETRLTTPVTRVDWSSADGGDVSLNGSERFDAALVTVPLGVLKQGSIIFTPALPVRKQTAIDRLGMGLLDKLYLRFDEVFWDPNAEWLVYATPKPNDYAFWLNLYAPLGLPILVGFAGGSAARRRAAKPDAQILAEAEAALTDMYPS